MLGAGEHFVLEVAGRFDDRRRHPRRRLRGHPRGDTANSGEIVVALVMGEEATLKRLRKKGALDRPGSRQPGLRDPHLRPRPGAGAGQAGGPDPPLSLGGRGDFVGVSGAVHGRWPRRSSLQTIRHLAGPDRSPCARPRPRRRGRRRLRRSASLPAAGGASRRHRCGSITTSAFSQSAPTCPASAASAATSRRRRPARARVGDAVVPPAVEPRFGRRAEVGRNAVASPLRPQLVAEELRAGPQQHGLPVRPPTADIGAVARRSRPGGGGRGHSQTATNSGSAEPAQPAPPQADEQDAEKAHRQGAASGALGIQTTACGRGGEERGGQGDPVQRPSRPPHRKGAAHAEQLRHRADRQRRHDHERAAAAPPQSWRASPTGRPG